MQKIVFHFIKETQSSACLIIIKPLVSGKRNVIREKYKASLGMETTEYKKILIRLSKLEKIVQSKAEN